MRAEAEEDKLLKKYADYSIPRPELFLDEEDDHALDETNLNDLHDNSGVSKIISSFTHFYFYFSKQFVKT